MPFPNKLRVDRSEEMLADSGIGGHMIEEECLSDKSFTKVDVEDACIGDDTVLSTEDADVNEAEDQLLYQWKCPNCHGCTDLQLLLQKGCLGGSTNQPYGNQIDDAPPDATQTSQSIQEESSEEPEKPLTFKEKGWLCVEITDDSRQPYLTAARIFIGTGLLFVLISVATFVAESNPRFYSNQSNSLFAIEATCIGFFTFELILRTVFCPDLFQHFTDWFTIIDILSILPFYITLAVGDNASGGLFVVRILRLMRIFRVLKVSKYNEAVHVVFGSLQKSTEGLYLLLFLILISTVLFASAMYFVERESSHYDVVLHEWYYNTETGRKRSPFQSILHTSWWALVTLTTVGYGNEVPVSAAGKAVAVVTMLCGTLVIAFPMVIIGQNFQEMYSQYRKRAKAARKKEMSNNNNNNNNNMKRVGGASGVGLKPKPHVPEPTGEDEFEPPPEPQLKSSVENEVEMSAVRRKKMLSVEVASRSSSPPPPVDGPSPSPPLTSPALRPEDVFLQATVIPIGTDPAMLRALETRLERLERTLLRFEEAFSNDHTEVQHACISSTPTSSTLTSSFSG